MPFVLDASVTMAWAFDDENHPLAAAALSRMARDEAIAPWIWWFEVRNALVTSELNERGTAEKSAAVILLLAELPIVIDAAPDEVAIFRLTRAHRLTFYDAAYLELAQRKRAGLATLDRKLKAAARKEFVEILEG